jgi:lycopene cyclase domain-containing protein
MQELTILILLFLVSLLLKIKFKEVLYHTKKERFLITSIIFITMMSWEALSHVLNVWIYPGPGMIGVYFFELPLELYIFYFILPDFVFTVYELIRKVSGKKYTHYKN